MPSDRLPNLVCPGYSKCATTWLHEVLASHPAVFAPTEVKEVGYYIADFDKGLDHYRWFYRNSLPEHEYLIDVTPSYVRNVECIERLIAADHIEKFVLMLRNPVDRFRSLHLYQAKLKGSSAAPETFFKNMKNGWMLPYRRVIELLQQHPTASLFITFQEDVLADRAAFLGELSDYMGLDRTGFEVSVMNSGSNEGNEVRFGGLFRIGIRVGRYLREHSLFSANAVLRKLKPLFMTSSKSAKIEFSPELVEAIWEFHAGDKEFLEDLLQRELPGWR